MCFLILFGRVGGEGGLGGGEESANLLSCGENARGLDSGIAFIYLLAAEIVECFISLTIVVALTWTGRASSGCV